MSLKTTILFAAMALYSAVNAQTNFNSGWSFRLDDGKDSKWKNVSIPHDWSIHQPFSKESASGNDGGYLPTGKGEYRKTFIIDLQMSDIYELYFEGVYMNAEVWVNGQLMGRHPYGYTSFHVNITKALNEGENTVVVKVDNAQQKNCRWYSGSGIYRNVWLIQKPKLSIDDWGVQIITLGNEVHVKTSITNTSDSNGETTLVTRLNNGMEKRQLIYFDAVSGQVVEQVFKVDHPNLWSPDNPYRYKAEVLLETDGEVIYRTEQWFGFRDILYNAANGFMLNGKPLSINGGCIHHDNGILGAAAWKDAEIRKVQLMKKAGYNAVRTSHNPPSEGFLDACDSLGLMVIDETFDGWRTAKNTYDYSILFDKYYKEDIAAMVKRDRNHPSIICWSVGNEIIERKEREAVATAFQLREEVHKWDTTRPITSALAAWDNDWKIYDPLASAQDIVGYNYMIHKAESDHQRVPERVMWQTESYPKDAFQSWKMVKDHPYIIGDFVWTAIDYVGESGIGRYWYEGDVEGEPWERPLWPWHGAYCGDIDLTGYLKPVAHYRSLLWNPDQQEKMYMAVYEPDGWKGKIHTGQWSTWPTVESWNWEGWENRNIDVVVYSREPEVKLYLNDQLIGTKTVSEQTGFKAVFQLPYASGELKAVAGNEEQIIRTAGKPHHIRLQVDRDKLSPDGLCYVDVWLEDKDGNICPNANNLLTFEVKGDGELLAAGNADITDTDSYDNSTHRLWHGHALAVVHAKEHTGNIILKVKSKGVSAAQIAIK